MFAGRVKLVNRSSCRTSAILKYFADLVFLIFHVLQLVGQLMGFKKKCKGFKDVDFTETIM